MLLVHCVVSFCLCCASRPKFKRNRYLRSPSSFIVFLYMCCGSKCRSIPPPTRSSYSPHPSAPPPLPLPLPLTLTLLLAAAALGAPGAAPPRRPTPSSCWGRGTARGASQWGREGRGTYPRFMYRRQVRQEASGAAHLSTYHTSLYQSIHPSVHPTHHGYHSASLAQIMEAACPSPPCRWAGTCYV